MFISSSLQSKLINAIKTIIDCRIDNLMDFFPLFINKILEFHNNNKINSLSCNYYFKLCNTDLVFTGGFYNYKFYKFYNFNNKIFKYPYYFEIKNKNQFIDVLCKINNLYKGNLSDNKIFFR